MVYIETSAKDDTNVARVFKAMAEKALVNQAHTRNVYVFC